MSNAPRRQQLAAILEKHGLTRLLWSISGPKDTSCSQISCYDWPAAKTVCIVQEFTRRGSKRRDIDGFEIFAPISRSDRLDELDKAMQLYGITYLGDTFTRITQPANGADVP